MYNVSRKGRFFVMELLPLRLQSRGNTLLINYNYYIQQYDK